MNDALTEEDVKARVSHMREEELLDFVRETVAQLESLADRLELYVNQRGEDKHA